MATPKQANLIAAVVAVAVFIVVLFVVDREGDFEAPRTITMATTTASPAPPAPKVTIRQTWAGGRRIGSSRTTQLQEPAAQPGTNTTTTTETEPRSVFERLLGDEVIELLVALLAAFLSAAVVQRILLGRYGGSGARAEAAAEKLDRDFKLELARIYALLAGLEQRDAGPLRGNGAGDRHGEQVSEARQQAERLAREAFALAGRRKS